MHDRNITQLILDYSRALLKGAKNSLEDYTDLVQNYVDKISILRDAAIIAYAHQKPNWAVPDDYVTISQYVLQNQPIYLEAQAHIKLVVDDFFQKYGPLLSSETDGVKRAELLGEIAADFFLKPFSFMWKQTSTTAFNPKIAEMISKDRGQTNINHLSNMNPEMQSIEGLGEGLFYDGKIFSTNTAFGIGVSQAIQDKVKSAKTIGSLSNSFDETTRDAILQDGSAEDKQFLQFLEKIETYHAQSSAYEARKQQIQDIEEKLKCTIKQIHFLHETGFALGQIGELAGRLDNSDGAQTFNIVQGAATFAAGMIELVEVGFSMNGLGIAVAGVNMFLDGLDDDDDDNANANAATLLLHEDILQLGLQISTQFFELRQYMIQKDKAMFQYWKLEFDRIHVRLAEVTMRLWEVGSLVQHGNYHLSLLREAVDLGLENHHNDTLTLADSYGRHRPLTLAQLTEDKYIDLMPKLWQIMISAYHAYYTGEAIYHAQMQHNIADAKDLGKLYNKGMAYGYLASQYNDLKLLNQTLQAQVMNPRIWSMAVFHYLRLGVSQHPYDLKGVECRKIISQGESFQKSVLDMHNALPALFKAYAAQILELTKEFKTIDTAYPEPVRKMVNDQHQWWIHQNPTPVRTIGKSLDYFFQPGNSPGTKYYGVNKVTNCNPRPYYGCGTKEVWGLNALWACSKPEKAYTPFGIGETCREQYKYRRVDRDRHDNLAERGCIHINEANGLQHAGLGDFWVQWGETSNGLPDILFYPCPYIEFVFHNGSKMIFQERHEIKVPTKDTITNLPHLMNYGFAEAFSNGPIPDTALQIGTRSTDQGQLAGKLNDEMNTVRSGAIRDKINYIHDHQPRWDELTRQIALKLNVLRQACLAIYWQPDECQKIIPADYSFVADEWKKSFENGLSGTWKAALPGPVAPRQALNTFEQKIQEMPGHLRNNTKNATQNPVMLLVSNMVDQLKWRSNELLTRPRPDDKARQTRVEAEQSTPQQDDMIKIMLTTLTQQFQLQLEHNKKLENRLDQLQSQNQHLQKSLDEFKEKTTTTYVVEAASVFDDRWPYENMTAAGDQRLYRDPSNAGHRFYVFNVASKPWETLDFNNLDCQVKQGVRLCQNEDIGYIEYSSKPIYLSGLWFLLATMIGYLVQRCARQNGAILKQEPGIPENTASYLANTRVGSRFGLWAEKRLVRSLEDRPNIGGRPSKQELIRTPSPTGGTAIKLRKM